ncbi:MAG: protein translocase subunit SecF [Endomicrobiaceae bacterium]|nr:protein translocase subunit SecF [Endomicrobiaceae bacterium]MDD5101506.1 protein translocase subunit SecF [Endomicrobiaceae bacterium]
MKFFKTPNIDFIGKRYIAFAFSIILIVSSIIAIAVKGPNYGIDFTGGILMQISFDKEIKLDDVRNGLKDAGNLSFELQSIGDEGIIIRVKKTDKSQDEMSQSILSLLQTRFPDNNIVVDRTEYVGPSVGKHLAKQATYAFIFVFLGIIVYVAFRFKSGLWGFTGVLALVHDVFGTFGLMVILGKEIDLTMIAAFLTIAGFSINDTIVLYDRIRENLRLLAKDNFGSIINKSINDVLSRTIITSLTVFSVSMILFFMGGEVIHDFALSMVIGTTLGVYSSVFICAPLTFEWEQKKRDRFKKSLKK